MVEFTDLQCPFCRQFHLTTFERLKREYIDTGKLRFISRDFPLDNLHPLATLGARANLCAGEQNRFWEMRHSILLGNAALTANAFSGFANDLGLDMAAFNRCVADVARFESAIERDVKTGRSIGVSGTPSFVVGRPEGSELPGILIAGARPYETFSRAIEGLLNDTR